MSFLTTLFDTLQSTLIDVIPIAAVLIGFQLLVLRQPIANAWKVLRGFAYVLLGLALFLMGLDKAIFPLGELMAIINGVYHWILHGSGVHSNLLKY